MSLEPELLIWNATETTHQRMPEKALVSIRSKQFLTARELMNATTSQRVF
jgi:hypothetical protein